MPNDYLNGADPGKVALVDPGASVTYGELVERVEATAGGLLAAGVEAGDRVAIIGPNDIAVVTALVAAHHIGAVACPYSSRNPTHAISDQVARLDPGAVLASPVAAELVSEAVGSGLEASVPVGTPSGAPSSDLPTIAGDRAARGRVAPDAPAVVLYTSGIVGPPRASVLSHQNLLTAQERIIAKDNGLGPNDTSFAVLPLAHVLGLNMCVLPALRVGATVVLRPNFDADESLAAIAHHRVTHMVGVPPMWASWVAAVERGGSADQLASVTFARTGASALNHSLAESVHEVFGLELGQGYGLTETAGTVTFEPDARRRPGSVGRALDGVELRLIEEGEEVELGDRGEVWIRTGSVFQGYLGDPAGTAEVLISDGWCRTGDIGIQDDDGTLYLIGRDKDLINVSGFNVFPGEVEEALETHASVSAAVVIGEPDAVTGERVVAYVVPAGSAAPDTDELSNHCRSRLSRYKVPVAIHVVERLPMTSTGKRVRSELRS